MSAQHLRQARYGTFLATVALLVVCGDVPNSLPAQSELLDKNRRRSRLLQRPAPVRWLVPYATL